MAQDLPYDYSDVEVIGDTVINKDDVLGQITILARKLKELEADKAKLELKLKNLDREIRSISESELPELFESVGQEELKIDGKKMKLSETIRCSLPKDRRARGIEWLDEHGHGGSVKRNVIVSFDKTQETKVEAFLRMIGRNWPNHAVERTIHSQTLLSILKNLLEEGETVDEELFGIFRQKVVKVAK